MRDRGIDVLVITQRYDPTVEFLIPFLDRAGLSWARWDPGQVPTRSSAGMHLTRNGWSSVIVIDEDESEIDLEKVGVVWYRRPSTNYAPAGIPTQDVGSFINDECAQFVANVWRCLRIPMVNDPFLGYLASQKALQLSVARHLGFRTPRTYMGNEPEAIRSLWGLTNGKMIVKGFRSVSVDLGEKGERSTYTAAVNGEDLLDDGPLAACPSIWQERIDKKVEIRATVVGNRVLAAEIHSQSGEGSNHDWRSLVGEVPYYPHDLPIEVSERCMKFVNEFGLHFGAMDLILTPQDEYVFLENNPFGQFAWIQEICGLPLAEALCECFWELLKRRERGAIPVVSVRFPSR